MSDFTRVYETQLEEPSRVTILSFRDCRKAVINDAVADPNTIILKSVGNPVTPSLEVDRLPTHEAFVTYDVLLNFTPLILMRAPQGSSILNITTVARLPQSTRVVMNAGAAAAPVTVTTYYGPADIKCDAFVT